jgi:hypothetical protein
MVTMRRLGSSGRFGNQIFQYAYLRIFCKEYQCPEWIGQRLFGHKDPPVTVRFRTVNEKWTLDITKSEVFGKDNIDVLGAFQYHTRCYPIREQFRSLFRPVPSVVQEVGVQIRMLRSGGHTLVGIHIRHGDYGRFPRRKPSWCFRAPTSWYLDWLKEHWMQLRDPVLLLASDDIENVLPDFADYKPITILPGPDFAPDYADFYMLTQCDYLLISNSSFSFAASMINEHNPTCFRPRLSEKRLIPYDPWDAPTVFMDERYD